MGTALVAASDFLFYGHPVGISLCIFLVLLAGAVLLCNKIRADPREKITAAAVLTFSLVPLFESLGLLSVLIALLGTAYFALEITGNTRARWPERLRRIGVVLTGDLESILESNRSVSGSPTGNKIRDVTTTMRGWIGPLLVGWLFVALFSAANPIFRSWIQLPDLRVFLSSVDQFRVLLWFLVALAISAVIPVRRFALKPADSEPQSSPEGETGRIGLASRTMIRSLVIFNLIFAVQTALDAVYLWGGADLPAGVSPAESAQKSAYILVLTALLAAGFVLAMVNFGETSTRRGLVRGLMYLWVAQNIVLVGSALFRLHLYVDAFALTQLRLAAFVWMALVAISFILMVFRVHGSMGHDAFMRANAIALSLVLYGYSIADKHAFIAHYNVSHSREVSGTGTLLDGLYVWRLGSSALPAIKFYLARSDDISLDRCADDLKKSLAERSDDWRAWNFREHRLRLAVSDLQGVGSKVENSGSR